MIRFGRVLVAVALGCMLAGCGNAEYGNTKLESQNAVEAALQNGIEKAQADVQEKEGTDSTQEKEKSEDGAQKKGETDGSAQGKEGSENSVPEGEGFGNNGQENEKEPEKAGEDVDIDLTSMGSDMVYATVYQFMMDPESYVGKKVKMQGSYYASFYEPTNKYYHYVIIADAAACCSQGIEFIWDEGEHAYPEEYPEEMSEVVVTGTFVTYTEENDPSLYCTLKDATLSLASAQ